MAKRTREFYEGILEDPRAQALIRTIMVAEGTANQEDGGLWTTFGYGTVPEEFRGAEHPYYTVPKDQREKVFKRHYMPSLGAVKIASAAGPTQFLARIAKNLRKDGYLLDWRDPREHYIAALRLADEGGALDPFLAGDMDAAHAGLRTRWDAFNLDKWGVDRLKATIEDSLRVVQENPIVAGRENSSQPARRKDGAMPENKDTAATEAPWVRSFDERVRQAEGYMRPHFEEIDKRIGSIYEELKSSLKPSTVEPEATKTFQPGFWTKLGVGLQGQGERITGGYREAESDRQNAELRAQQLQVENDRATADRQARLMGDATSAALQKANIYGGILSSVSAEHGADMRAAGRGTEKTSDKDRFTMGQMFSESPDGQFIDSFISAAAAGQLVVLPGGVIPLSKEQETARMNSDGSVLPRVPLSTHGDVDGPLLVGELTRQYDLAHKALLRAGLPADMYEERKSQLESAFNSAWESINNANRKVADELASRGLAEATSDTALMDGYPERENYGSPAYAGADSYEEAMEIYRNIGGRGGTGAYPRPVKPTVDTKIGQMYRDMQVANDLARKMKIIQDQLFYGTNPLPQGGVPGLPQEGQLGSTATGGAKKPDGRKHRFIPRNGG